MSVDLSAVAEYLKKQNTPGATTGTTSQVTGTVDLAGLPQGGAAYYAGQDWNKFMADWGPLIEKQMASLKSTKLVDQAQKDAAVVPGLMAAATERAAARRGGMTASQRTAMTAQRGLTKATSTADMLNNARIDQRQRNTDVGLSLSGLGTDIYQMGLDSVRESEGLAAQRKMNNDAAKSQYKSNLLSGALTLGAAAAFGI